MGDSKTSSSFIKATTTTLRHTISESKKSSYVAHINSFLGEDKFLKDFLPMDPSTDALFELAKDGVLLCKLINVVVPGTIDERAINTKKVLNSWERNENHTLCLNSSKAIGSTVVNIGTQDLVEARPHLVVGLISQLIKVNQILHESIVIIHQLKIKSETYIVVVKYQIQLLADLNLKKTPQLVELVEDTTVTTQLPILL
ncbi:hypothetical protein ACS0TY_031014 [Phlomoides rotata]